MAKQRSPLKPVRAEIMRALTREDIELLDAMRKQTRLARLNKGGRPPETARNQSLLEGERMRRGTRRAFAKEFFVAKYGNPPSDEQVRAIENQIRRLIKKMKVMMAAE